MNPDLPGPIVPEHEDMFRGITTLDWWVADESRPSSAAFRNPDFSVDIVSLAVSPDHTLAHLRTGSGIVQFNSGEAQGIGLIPRQEPDPDHPENHAHANVYNEGNSNQRKKRAQQLVKLCTVVISPSFT